MRHRWKALRGAGCLLALFTLGALAAAPRPPAVDVRVLVASDGKGPDQLAVTYSSSVPEPQARQDLQNLAAAVNQPLTQIRITTKRISPLAPPMTSAEARLPDLVKRAEGSLAVQPFVDTYRRFSHLRLSYFIEPPFKLASPTPPPNSSDVQMTVDNQGPVVSYDVRIRHATGAGQSPALDGASTWTRLLGPLLFLAVLVAAGIGIAVFVLVRRSSAQGASTG